MLIDSALCESGADFFFVLFFLLCKEYTFIALIFGRRFSSWSTSVRVSQ